MNIGDRIHGFAGGYFGRDSYDCRVVEHIGFDWVILRKANGSWESATLNDARRAFAEYGKREQDFDGNWCCDD
jgi:hypothetical protein